MPKQPIMLARARRLANERTLYRYQQALARGDLETITAILQEASQDATLEQMLYALHNFEQLEEPLPITTCPRQQDQRPTFTSFPLLKLRSHTKRPIRQQHAHPRLQTLAAVLVVLALLTSFTALFSNMSFHRKISTATKTVTTPQGIIILLFDDGDVQAVRPVTGLGIWGYNLGLGDLNQPLFYNALSVQNHVVYVMAMNHLYALDEETGHLLWEKVFPLHLTEFVPNSSQVDVDSGIVYMSIQGDPQSAMYALDAADGHLLWQVTNNVPTNVPFLSANNGIAYLVLQGAGSSQATIEARRGSDGSILWKYQTTGNILSAEVTDQILYAYVYLGPPPALSLPALSENVEKHLLALKTSNGNRIWSHNIHDTYSGTYNINITYAQGTLVVGDGVQLCTYNASNGSQLWCTDPSPLLTPINPPPAVEITMRNYLAGGQKLYTAYVTQNSKPLSPTEFTIQSSVQIKAFDFQTGQALWMSNALVYNGIFDGAYQYSLLPLDLVQLQQNTLLVSNGTSFLTGLDADNGHVLWQVSDSDTSNNASAPSNVLQVVASAS